MSQYLQSQINVLLLEKQIIDDKIKLIKQLLMSQENKRKQEQQKQLFINPTVKTLSECDSCFCDFNNKCVWCKGRGHFFSEYAKHGMECGCCNEWMPKNEIKFVLVFDTT